MKTILIVHFAFAVLTIVLTFLVALAAKSRLRQVYDYMESPKHSVAETILIFTQLLAFALFPIVNIIYCLNVIFNTDSTIDEVANKLDAELVAVVKRDK